NNKMKNLKKELQEFSDWIAKENVIHVNHFQVDKYLFLKIEEKKVIKKYEEAAEAAGACKGQLNAFKKFLLEKNQEKYDEVIRGSWSWLIEKKIKHDVKLDGKAIVYFESGKIRYESTYVNGEREGKGLGYFESGKIVGEENYLNGEREGKRIEYFESGKIRYEENYLNGAMEGKWIAYFE